MTFLKHLRYPSTAIARHPDLVFTLTTSGGGGSGDFTFAVNQTVGVERCFSCKVVLDDFTGFSTTDPRFLYCEIDFGERVTLTALDDSYVPTGSKFLQGKTAGLYRGPIAGHVFHGVDTSGNTLFGGSDTATRTVSMYVTDGVTSATKTFDVTIIRRLAYYQDYTCSTYTEAAYPDRTHSDGTTLPGLKVHETKRRIRVMHMGDTTNAPAADGFYVQHINVDNGSGLGVFDREDVWSSGPGTDTAFLVMLEGGQSFEWKDDNTSPLSNSPLLGPRCTWTSYYPTGVTAKPILDIQTQLCSKTGNNAWLKNSSSMDGWASGFTLDDINFFASDHVSTSDEANHVWWSTLNYTGTATLLAGDILTDGSGGQAEVIRDLGGGQVEVYEVVDGSDNAYTFSDGATLTNGG